MFILCVLLIRFARISVGRAITTPRGREGDGIFLPSGGTGGPTPCNFTPPDTLYFLLIRSSLPGHTGSNTPFCRIPWLTIRQFIVVLSLGVMFNLSPEGAVFGIGVSVLISRG